MKGMVIKMTRQEARELAVRLAFEISGSTTGADEILGHLFDREYFESLSEEDELFRAFPDDNSRAYIERVIRGVDEHNMELDEYVMKYAKGWKFERISRTALAVMKVCMFETLYMPDVPVGASVNSAVELSKKYDEQDTVAFVNGILGSFVREEVKR